MPNYTRSHGRSSICTLDEKIYERAAIKDWLTKHRTSPWNRKPLDEGVDVDSVLYTNRDLRGAIEDLKARKPQLFEQEELTLKGFNM